MHCDVYPKTVLYLLDKDEIKIQSSFSDCLTVVARALCLFSHWSMVLIQDGIDLYRSTFICWPAVLFALPCQFFVQNFRDNI